MNRVLISIRYAFCLALMTATSVAIAQDLPLVDGAMGQKMVYGPYISHSVGFRPIKNQNQGIQPGAIPRGMVVKLADQSSICYDMNRLTVAGFWTADNEKQTGFVDFKKTHYTTYKGGLPARPDGRILYDDLENAGWLDGKTNKPIEAGELTFSGHYLHGQTVVLSYAIGGRQILESPTSMKHDGTVVYVRIMQVSASDRDLTLLLGKLQGGKVSIDGAAGVIKDDKKVFAASVSGSGQLTDSDGGLYVSIPASKQDKTLILMMAAGDAEVAHAVKAIKIKPADLEALTKGGPPRWGQVVTTQGTLSKKKAAYVSDDLPVPMKNPWGAWMRLTGVDFFSDGRAAISTLSGDVWTVAWDEKLSNIQWRRFATGMYEPLGLKIINDKILVRGRDRITRLHDLNNDGEADYYENFHSAGMIGTSYHAFLFDLVTDKAGNIYFARSGRKSVPPGEVVRLSPDGKQRKVVATHFRHPNGMGGAGVYDWILIADNPNGKFPSGAMIVREGEMYGHEGPRTAPYLFLLPPQVDTSSGSQCWSDTKRWGPLSGTLAHTSFSKSVMCYVMVENATPYPNGYAVKFKLPFKSGMMRTRVNPKDGQVYAIGQRGWDTNAAVDGSFNRIRYTGQKAYLVTAVKASQDGLTLTFSCDLDPQSVSDDGFSAKRSDGKKDTPIKITSVKLLKPNTVFVGLSGIDPNAIFDRKVKLKDKRVVQTIKIIPPIVLTFDLDAKDGALVHDTVYGTVNSVTEK